MCSLAIYIASFTHLLKRVDFDPIVDHIALTHIIKSKVEPYMVWILTTKIPFFNNHTKDVFLFVTAIIS